MSRTLYIIICTIAILNYRVTKCCAQKTNTVRISQQVKDSFTKVGIPNAKVYLMDQSQEVLDTFRTKGREGWWAKEMDRTPRTYIIKVEHPDYETQEMTVEVKNLYRNRYMEIPNMLLKRRHTLKEVVVTASKVKIAYKDDTLEVNASAFNIPEGSMLSGLVASIPGCELKPNGEILMNGRRVDYLLLNGKDFFRGNNGIMLDNLPYYVVNKLQFYEKQDKDAYALKKDYVMDVRLKRDYEIGLLGNTELAGGTRDRWLARLFGLRFTNNSRISLFGNANNINQLSKPTGNGDWAAFSQAGEVTSRYLGANVMVDDKDGRFNENAEAMARWDKNEDETRASSASYLADGKAFSRLQSLATSRNRQIDVRNKLQLRSLTLTSSWKHHHNDASELYRSVQFSDDPSVYSSIFDSLLMINTSSALRSIAINSRQKQNVLNGTDWALRQKVDWDKDTKWGDNYTLDFDGSIDHIHRNNTSLSVLNFYQNPSNKEQIEQYQWHHEQKYQYAAGGAYRFHLLSGIHLGASYHFRQSYCSTESNLFQAIWNAADLPSMTDHLLQLDQQNSYTSCYLSRQHEVVPFLAYFRNQGADQLLIQLQLKLSRLHEKEIYHRGEIDANIRRNYTMIEPQVNFQWSKEKWAWSAEYTLKQDIPSIIRTIDYTDTSDPLRIERGNAALKPSKQHAISMEATRLLGDYTQRVSFLQDLCFTRHMIAESVAYDASTGVYTFQPMNVNGNWNSKTQIILRKAIDRKKLLYLNATTNLSYFRNVDLVMLEGSTESQLSKVNNYITEQNLSMEYQRGKLFFSLNGSIAWNKVSRRHDAAYGVNAWSCRYGFRCRYALPWQINLATDLTMYSRRGYDEPRMNTDDLVWNATLSKSFFKGKLTALLEGYDLLHQLSNVSYVVNGQGRTETWQRSLPNYLMIHLTYKFHKSPKKASEK